MKVLRFLSYTFIFPIILSCSSDDKITQQEDIIDDPIDNIRITGYKNTYISEYIDAPYNYYEEIIIGELINNKYFSYLKETFLDGDLKTSIGGQNFFYENELLTKRISDNDEENVLHFTYNNDGSEVDVFWEKNNGYYRLKFISESVGHFERLSSNNELVSRIIVTFDENDNITETRVQNINSGELQDPNLFTYENNNLTGIQFQNGESITIGYTNILNTSTLLKDRSYGKKMRRLLLAQSYMISSSQLDMLLNLNTSNQISVDDANNSQYEMADNGYFYKKTTVREFDENANFQGTNTVTLEFTFD